MDCLQAFSSNAVIAPSHDLHEPVGILSADMQPPPGNYFFRNRKHVKIIMEEACILHIYMRQDWALLCFLFDGIRPAL